MFVSPNAEFYIPNWREFSIDFKNKANNNIRGQLPLSKQKGLRGVLMGERKMHTIYNSLVGLIGLIANGLKVEILESECLGL